MDAISYKTLLYGIKHWADNTFLKRNDDEYSNVKSSVGTIKNDIVSLSNQVIKSEESVNDLKKQVTTFKKSDKVVLEKMTIDLEWDAEMGCYKKIDAFPSKTGSSVYCIEFNGEDYFLPKTYLVGPVVVGVSLYYSTSYGGTTISDKVLHLETSNEPWLDTGRYGWTDETTPFIICSSWKTPSMMSLFSKIGDTITLAIYEAKVDNIPPHDINCGNPASITNGGAYVTGDGSIGVGRTLRVNGDHSAAFGSGNTVNTHRCLISGFCNTANASSSLAIGQYGETTSTAPMGAVFGNYNISNARDQFVIGQANIKDVSAVNTSHGNNARDLLFIVGNGANSNADATRSNAHTLDWNGNAWYSGDVYVGSSSGKNKDAGSKKLATEEFVLSNNIEMTDEEFEALFKED